MKNTETINAIYDGLAGAGARTCDKLSLSELKTQLAITKPHETTRITYLKKLIDIKSK